MWEAHHKDTFRKCIQVLSPDFILAPYSFVFLVLLTSDASQDGAGAVLSHIVMMGKTVH